MCRSAEYLICRPDSWTWYKNHLLYLKEGYSRLSLIEGHFYKMDTSLGRTPRVGYLNEVQLRPRFRKSLDLQISSLEGSFKKTNAFVSTLEMVFTKERSANWKWLKTRLCLTLAKLRLNNWPVELAPSFPWAPAYSLYLTLHKTDIVVPKVSVLQRIDPFTDTAAILN